MIIQPRLTTTQPQQPAPPPQEQPKDPVIMDGFSPAKTMATASVYTAAVGGALGLALTRDPSNLFGNVLGGAVGGTILAPMAAAANLEARGFSKEQAEAAGTRGLYGGLAGAGAGCMASLALSLAFPEGRLLEASAVVLAVGGAALGSALAAGHEG